MIIVTFCLESVKKIVIVEIIEVRIFLSMAFVFSKLVCILIIMMRVYYQGNKLELLNYI